MKREQTPRGPRESQGVTELVNVKRRQFAFPLAALC